MRFGQTVLSHPLIVDAIAAHFHPVLVYNNRGGADAALLKRFREPSWNNPVVRFLDGRGADLLPRRDGVWKIGPIIGRMVSALATARREVPAWLELLEQEARSGEGERATFAVTSLDEAEAGLGGFDGVLALRPGAIDDDQAIELRFASSVITYPDLVRAGVRLGCVEAALTLDAQQQKTAPRELGKRVRPLTGTLRPGPVARRWRWLRESPLRYLPLSDLQMLRVNAALAAGREPDAFLSPGQQRLLARIRKKLAADPDALDAAPGPGSALDLAARTAALEKLL